MLLIFMSVFRLALPLLRFDSGSVAKIFDLLVDAFHRYRGLRLTLGSDCVVTMVGFKGSHYPKSVILFAVFFYLRYPVSYCDLEEIKQERGVDVDHATLNRWVAKYPPRLRPRPKGRNGRRRNRGAWTRRISGSRASGCITTARWTGMAKPLISCFQSGATSRRRGASSVVRFATMASRTAS